MKTICPGWVTLPSHRGPVVLSDDGVADGRERETLCYDCAEVFRLALEEDRPTVQRLNINPRSPSAVSDYIRRRDEETKP